MYFGHESDHETEQIAEGAFRASLCKGEKLELLWLEIKGGTTVPEHAHPHEQAGYILKGKFRANVGGKEAMLGKGHYCWIPSNVPHSGFVEEDTIIIEVYSPPRSS